MTVEDTPDARHHRVPEGAHGALDHVVRHRAKFEDQPKAHQIDLIREMEDRLGHGLRAAENHHVVRDGLVKRHGTQHRHLFSPAIVAVRQPAAVRDLRAAIAPVPVLQQPRPRFGTARRVAFGDVDLAHQIKPRGRCMAVRALDVAIQRRVPPGRLDRRVDLGERDVVLSRPAQRFFALCADQERWMLALPQRRRQRTVRLGRPVLAAMPEDLVRPDAANEVEGFQELVSRPLRVDPERGELGRAQTAAEPRSKRPLVRLSSMAASSATSIGCRNGKMSTMLAKRMRLVRCAAATISRLGEGPEQSE